jgi:hypothetical protein
MVVARWSGTGVQPPLNSSRFEAQSLRVSVYASNEVGAPGTFECNHLRSTGSSLSGMF